MLVPSPSTPRIPVKFTLTANTTQMFMTALPAVMAAVVIATNPRY